MYSLLQELKSKLYARNLFFGMLLLAVLHLIVIKASAQGTNWNNAAAWISNANPEDSIHPCPVFTKSFIIQKPVQSATLLITARGLYEAELNGQRVGNAFFTPGWTSYDRRILYQTYPVSNQLKTGDNKMVVTVADGWYRGVFGGLAARNNYGDKAGLLCQLHIVYADGSKEDVVSDTSWRAATGALLYSSIYDGELYDARVPVSPVSNVIVQGYDKSKLFVTEAEPVTKQEVIQPQRLFTAPNGEQVIDFGQNLAGWVRFKAKGNAGDTIKLFHAEVLDKAGNFYTGNLREAKAMDVYVLKGNGVETFEPHFTYHGFRYVKVVGCKVEKENFNAVALYSAVKNTGQFSCSNPAINQLQSNITWSLNGNFLDLPTDCPQRSERLGWTGDAQVFFRTASFNRQVQLFFTKWLQDLKADQGSNGAVTRIVPDLYGHTNTGAKRGVAGWGDAATIIPWTMYWVYNDTAILNNQYASMKGWVDYIQSASKNYLWEANGYGDWLAPGDSTSLPYIDQCFWAHSTQLLVNAATVLGKTADVAYYTQLLQKVKSSFLQTYVYDTNKPNTHTQTAYALALQFDLLPDSVAAKAAANLVALIKQNNNHLATGFLGTPYLLLVLSKYGYHNVAFDLINQNTYPSWLYPVKMGATTIWEKWNAILPDSNVQATSYNHYAYGAVGDWLYRVVAGIDAASPGYKNIIIKPVIGGGLTWVAASYECAFGKISSSWKLKGKKVNMQVTIPPHTTATVFIPGKGSVQAGPGTYRYTGVLQ